MSRNQSLAAGFVLANPLDFIAMEPHHQEKERQQDEVHPETVFEIEAEPGLNKISCEAFEANLVGMSGVGRNGRYARDYVGGCELAEKIQAQQRKDKRDRQRSFALESPTH